MKIAICDDSQAQLTAFVKIASTDTNLVKAYLSGDNLYRSILHGERFDLIFLDIDMPGMSGIDTAKAIRTIDGSVVIVFITNYAQYALEAFECEAFHYLIKPISEERIADVISRVENKLSHTSDYHVLKMRGKSIKIPISDIYYVECVRKHLLYHTGHNTFEIVGTISNAYKTLIPHDFIMIHQGYIVNMDKIVDFDEKYVILDNGEKVEMSIRKRKDALLRYAKFIERYI